MEKFAKIFDVGEHQLLVWIESAEADDNTDGIVHQIVQIGGVQMELSFNGPMHAMEKLFEMYEQQTAENLFKNKPVSLLLDGEAEDD